MCVTLPNDISTWAFHFVLRLNMSSSHTHVLPPCFIFHLVLLPVSRFIILDVIPYSTLPLTSSIQLTPSYSIWLCVCLRHSACVKGRGQFTVLGSLLLSCWFWNSNSGCQAWWQLPFSSELSYQPQLLVFKLFALLNISWVCLVSFWQSLLKSRPPASPSWIDRCNNIILLPCLPLSIHPSYNY